MTIADQLVLLDTQLHMHKVLAEIEGMKAFNAERLSHNLSTGYNEQHFQQAAQDIENLRVNLKKHFAKQISQRIKERSK